MKKIKINLLAIIGMMVAVATLAFTAPKPSSNIATAFTYLGSNLEGATMSDPNSWTTAPSQSCNGLTLPCEVIIDDSEVTDIPSLVDHLDSMLESEAAQLLKDSAISSKN